MTDEQPKPAPQPGPFAPIDKPAAVDPAPATPAADSPEERLRAFEDAMIGEDAPRFQGQLEKGHGSLFHRLSDEDKAHHAALVALCAAGENLADARADLTEAQGVYDEAERKVEAAAAAADAKRAADDAKAARLKAKADAAAAAKPAPAPVESKPAELPPAATGPLFPGPVEPAPVAKPTPAAGTTTGL